MKGIVGTAVGGIFLLLGAGGAFATPPPPGGTFNCTKGVCNDGTQCSTMTDCSSGPCTNGTPPDCEEMGEAGCVSNTKNHAKCSSAIGKTFAKAITSVTKCHCKLATARSKGVSAADAAGPEEDCEEGKAKAKFDAALTKLTMSGLCASKQLTQAGLGETLAFNPTQPTSLDQKIGNDYCDSASMAFLSDKLCFGGTNDGNPCTADSDCPGMPAGKCIREDAGFVPNTPDILKCECDVSKAASKLFAAGIKCHDKMNKAFFAGKSFDEETCEQTDPISHKGAEDKFNQQRDKDVTQKMICPPCMGLAGWNGRAADSIGTLDALNGILYPCKLGSPSGAFLDPIY